MECVLKRATKRSIAIIAVCAFVVSSLLLGCLRIENVSAESGAAFGTGSVSGDSKPGHSSASGGNDGCSYYDNGVDCKGVSWIFYKSLGPTESISFSPYGMNGKNDETTIAKECSEHTSENGGFWHFGRNARARLYNGDTPGGDTSSSNMIPYFSDYTLVMGRKTGTYLYSTELKKMGHMMTYNYGYGGDNGTTPYATNHYLIFSNGDLNQTLYKNNVAIYSADHYSAKAGEVLNEFKTAYSYAAANNKLPDGWASAYGESYTQADLPSDLRYFCYWDGMENVTLTTYAYVGSTSGTKLSGPDVQTIQTSKDSTANYEDPYKENNKLKFHKWVNENGHTVDAGGAVSHNGSTLNITGQKKDRTFYALYYAPVTLTGKAIDYTTGDYITGIAEVSSGEVIHGGSAEVTRRTKSEWHFVGWCSSKKKECTDLGTGATYTENPINSNTTVYAVYKPYRTLSGQSVDESGNNLAWSDTDTVVWGNTATLETAPATTTDANGNVHGFIKWIGSNGNDVPVCPRGDGKLQYACVSPDNSRRLGVPTLTSDRTYYAVYGRRSLTRHAVEYGNCSTDLKSDATTVAYNASATVYAWDNWDNWVYQGYTTSRSNNCNSSLNTNTSYTVNPLTSNADVFFVYRRRYHISVTMKDVSTRANFDALQAGTDSVDKYSTLGYTGTVGTGTKSTTYSSGVWGTDVWRGGSYYALLPDLVTIGSTTYKKIGLYWVDNSGEDSQYCSNTLISGKSAAYPTHHGDYDVSSNSATTCYSIWGAYVAVRHLTALAYDTGNSYIGDSQHTTATSKWPATESYKRVADQQVTVFNGETASLTRNTNVGYTFKGWKEACPYTWCGYFTGIDTNQASYLSNSGTTYTVKSLTANGTVYPIYEIRQLTLTGKAVDGGGNSLASVSGLADKTDTVDYWSPASVTRGMAEGYTFYGWAESLNNAKNGTYLTRTTGGTYVSAASNSTITNVDNTYSPRGVYHVSSMTDSSTDTVYARYDRNEIQGRVRVSNGSSVNESSNTSTGWVETNNSQSLTIECKNYTGDTSGGCQATFDIYLKTIKGLGKTNFAVMRKKNSENNGEYKPVSVQLNLSPKTYSPASPSTSGTAVVKVTGNYTETLYPGQTVCYKLAFAPYGQYANPNTTNSTGFAYLTVCASGKVSTFEGKSSVTGATTGTTDWRKVSRTERVTITNCPPTSGCQVSFNHRLKRTDGTLGWTDYTIARTSNLTDTTRGIANNASVKTGQFNPTSPTTEGEVSSTGPFTLYPGMVVCESLTFKTHNNYVNTASNVTTKICASALGKAQPDDPTPSSCDEATDPSCSSDPNGDTGSNALVDIEVKNNSVTKYNTYRRIVYGKPGDSLTYQASYNPNLQYTYYLKPEQMKIDGGTTVYPSNDGTNTTKSLATMFNEHKTPGWNNDLYVCSSEDLSSSKPYDCKISGISNAYSRAYSYNNGDFSKQTETNDHTVAVLEVGRSLNENAEINYTLNNTIRTTPAQVTFTSRVCF